MIKDKSYSLDFSVDLAGPGSTATISIDPSKFSSSNPKCPLSGIQITETTVPINFKGLI